jgi:hypothetical protein
MLGRRHRLGNWRGVETLGSRFGTCACGGAFEERVVQVAAPRTGKQKDAQLPEVEQGVCPLCGSRVYKTLSLQCVEAAFRALKLPPT